MSVFFIQGLIRYRSSGTEKEIETLNHHLVIHAFLILSLEKTSSGYFLLTDAKKRSKLMNEHVQLK